MHYAWNIFLNRIEIVTCAIFIPYGIPHIFLIEMLTFINIYLQAQAMHT